MIKVFVLISAIFLSISILPAQDLIVTITNDSLNCKIDKIKGDYIHYSELLNDKINNSALPMNLVRVYSYNYYHASFLQQAQKQENNLQGIYTQELTKKSRQYSKVSFNVLSGFGYQTEKIPHSLPPDVISYLNKLRRGFHITTTVTGYSNKYFGAGIKYSIFSSKSGPETISLEDPDTGQMIDETIKHHIVVHFLAPQICARIPLSDFGFLNFTFSAGYLRYRSDRSFYNPLKIYGDAFGLEPGISADMFITKNIAFTLGVSQMFGVLKKIIVHNQIYDLSKENYEGLSRLDASVGLRLFLNRKT